MEKMVKLDDNNGIVATENLRKIYYMLRYSMSQIRKAESDL